MSRTHKIRWRSSDEQELRRLAKNFNAKVRRLEKKRVPGQVIPETVSVKELKKLIGTRQDLKRELRSLEKFTKRGSEVFVKVPDNDNNLQITKWQLKEMKRMERLEAKRVKAERERLAQLEATSRGQGLGYTVKQAHDYIGMGRMQDIDLTPTKAFTPTMSQSDINKKFRVLRNKTQTMYYTKRDIVFRDNFIKALERNFDNSINPVIEQIKSMSIDQFKEIMYQEGGRLAFEYAYPQSTLVQDAIDEEYEDEKPVEAIENLFLVFGVKRN